ncbi:hypothetical protein COOONC_21785 [Cooperia oncophora]
MDLRKRPLAEADVAIKGLQKNAEMEKLRSKIRETPYYRMRCIHTTTKLTRPITRPNCYGDCSCFAKKYSNDSYRRRMKAYCDERHDVDAAKFRWAEECL